MFNLGLVNHVYLKIFFICLMRLTLVSSKALQYCMIVNIYRYKLYKYCYFAVNAWTWIINISSYLCNTYTQLNLFITIFSCMHAHLEDRIIYVTNSCIFFGLDAGNVGKKVNSYNARTDLRATQIFPKQMIFREVCGRDG